MNPDKDLQFEELRQILIDSKLASEAVAKALASFPEEFAEKLAATGALTKNVELTEDSKQVSIVDFEHIKEWLADTKKEIVEAVKDAKADEVSVSNLGDIEATSEVAINNIDALAEKLKEIIERNITVKVEQPQLDSPQEVEIANWPSDPKQAIPVVLVDKELKKFYNAMAGMGTAFMGRTAAGGVQSSLIEQVGGKDVVRVKIEAGSITVDKVGLENIDGDNINPATEDKQDDMIVLLTSLLAAIDVAVNGEVPAGAKNGVNLIFSTAYSYKTNSTRLFLNGVRQLDPGDYLESSPNTVQFVLPPINTDTITIDYVKA